MTRIGGPPGAGFRQPEDAPKTDEAQARESGATPAKGGGPEQPKRVGPVAEAERLAAQSAFVRGGNKKRRGIDLGDGSEAAIPLPEDDLADIELDTAGLEGAEQALMRHFGALASTARRRTPGPAGWLETWAAIIAGERGEGDDDADEEQRQAERAQALQQLQAEPSPDADGLAALRQSMHAHFGVDMDTAPVGPQLMAASLLVAGMQQDVQAAVGGETGVDAQKLFNGASRVIDAGRQAAQDARTRSETTAKHIALNRTFVPKR